MILRELPALGLAVALLASLGFTQGVTTSPAGGHAATDAQECPPLRRIGYFIEWGVYAHNYHPLDIPADKVTHINYAFANTVRPEDE